LERGASFLLLLTYQNPGLDQLLSFLGARLGTFVIFGLVEEFFSCVWACHSAFNAFLLFVFSSQISLIFILVPAIHLLVLEANDQ